MSIELRIRVANVLMSPAAQQVDFQCETIVVNSASLLRVYYALIQGAIDVVVGGLPPGAEAAYHRGRNSFRLPNVAYGSADNEERATLFHESIHAMGDVDRGWWRGFFESEAAAYIGECLYYEYLTGSTLAADFGVSLAPQKILASGIAESIRGRKGAVVDINAVWSLRQKIQRRPIYHRIRQTDLTSDDGVYR